MLSSLEMQSNKCRTPPGVRGLKLHYAIVIGIVRVSHPTRGAWIETLRKPANLDFTGRTPPGVRGLKHGLD